MSLFRLISWWWMLDLFWPWTKRIYCQMQHNLVTVENKRQSNDIGGWWNTQQTSQEQLNFPSDHVRILSCFTPDICKELWKEDKSLSNITTKNALELLCVFLLTCTFERLLTLTICFYCSPLNCLSKMCLWLSGTIDCYKMWMHNGNLSQSLKFFFHLRHFRLNFDKIMNLYVYLSGNINTMHARCFLLSLAGKVTWFELVGNAKSSGLWTKG